MADPAQSRRSILQGLQQTRSRLQRLHSDEPQAQQQRSLSSVSGGARPGATPIAPPTSRPSPSGTPPQPAQMLAPPTRTMHTSPSPVDSSYIAQQQKMAMQQVHSQSFGYYISQPSLHGNMVLPVLPRFDSNGQLIL